MRIRFWGTRGSHRQAGPDHASATAATPRASRSGRDGTLIVLDCGTGAHGLGQPLMADRPSPLRGHLLISHTHWDHIQGFPFFAPLFVPGNEWDVYGPRRPRPAASSDTLAGQMQYTYFPVTLEQLGATIRYHDLVEGAFDIGDVRVAAHYLNHPALTLGYRLEADGATVVYATDHEPHSRPHADGRSGAPIEPLRPREDARHVAVPGRCRPLIHDAQYTARGVPEKVGWGHTPVECAVDFAVAGRATAGAVPPRSLAQRLRGTRRRLSGVRGPDRRQKCGFGRRSCAILTEIWDVGGSDGGAAHSRRGVGGRAYRALERRSLHRCANRMRELMIEPAA